MSVLSKQTDKETEKEGLTPDEMNVPETQEKEIEHIVQEQERPVLSDVKSTLESDIDPNILSNNELKNLISTLFDHSKRIEAMREKAIQILANRMSWTLFLN